MKFSIAAWNAVSPYHQEKNDWSVWAEDGASLTRLKHSDSWDLSFLPAIKRRRLSGMAKMVFAAAWSVLPESQACPLVFVSHDGEVNRSFQLWESLLKDEGVSPTSFALSVHNAVAGQWSLLRGDVSESVAISARENGLEVAITEACGLLSEGETCVLVVVAEEPIACAEVDAERAPFPFALALLVTTGDTYDLQYRAAPSDTAIQNAYYSSSLAWIRRQVLDEAGDFEQVAESGVWTWQTNHADD